MQNTTGQLQPKVLGLDIQQRQKENLKGFLYGQQKSLKRAMSDMQFKKSTNTYQEHRLYIQSFEYLYFLSSHQTFIQYNNLLPNIIQIKLLFIFYLSHSYSLLYNCIYQMSAKGNPKVYMDIQIGAKGAGRIIFELFTDFTPKTTENFRGLCTGEYQSSDKTKLTYQNSKFHRILEGFVIQGGDITHGNGTGGCSIYGRVFNDQNFSRKHSCAGLLSMANCGRNTNSSQFFITLKPCPHLDDKHVVFGQVIDGMQIVKQIAKVPIDKKQKPKIPVMIVGCGQIGDFKSFLTFDPFQKSAQEKIRKKREQIIKDQHLMRKLLSQGIDPNEAYNYKRKLQKCEKDLNQLLKEEQLLKLEAQNRAQQEEEEQQQVQQPDQPENISDKIRERLGVKNVNRLMDIKMRINEAKVQNSKAAIDEDIRENDMNYNKMIKRQDYQEKRSRSEKELAAKGLDKSKLYLNRNAIKKDKQGKQDQSFGWNVFGEDAYYKAYDRRCEKLKFDPQKYKQQMENTEIALIQDNKPSQQVLNNLVEDLQKQQAKRNSFSRRRIYDEDEQVTYINQRNRVYNKKLDRSYGNFTAKIKTALQMNNQK